ncbi:lipopolysaccharide biosynthesis protein [Quadrisphaera oryzae]|uniref:lipopolysaccharide biosynthesis protein n=1 Tax=Quadrisphaera TaxID=317661 RepID=UPI00164479C0|nr:oligosaccharide flippase family protein [Quadrisphaera sp. RL12-1S]
MTSQPTSTDPTTEPHVPGETGVPTENAVPTEKPAVSMRRAMAFTTTTSMLVPVIGVVTAPVLARALGVEGRGEVATAMAPAALVAAVATLGLPEALTYHLARRPDQTRRALVPAALVSLLLGAVCWGLSWGFASVLTKGDAQLIPIMLVGTALALPQMLVGLLRGAAVGLQMWGAVAADRALSSLLRLVVLLALALAGALDVRVAVIAMSVIPVVTGLVYWRVLLRRPPAASGAAGGAASPPPSSSSITRDVLSFGSSTWLGAVASMATGRVAQLMTTPLSDATQLGLLVVAITISDVLFILITAVRDTLFGVNARFDDREQLMAISRSALLVGAVGALVLGATVPLWIGPVFGEQFAPATEPTWWLLVAAVTNIPGLMAGAGLGAWGRPGLRSASFVVALVVLVGAFFLLVPSMGAVGAGIAAIASGTAMSVFAVVLAARVNRSSPWAFVVPRGSDVVALGHEGARLLRAVRAHLPRARS